MKKKTCNVNSLTFKELEEIYENRYNGLNWNCLFVLPFWLEPWLKAFGRKKDPLLLAVTADDELTGIAPLIMEGTTARFMGGENICDYQDMIVKPDCGDLFFSTLLPYLKRMGASALELGALRPDSSVLTAIYESNHLSGCRISYEEAGTVFELDLPGAWDDYLGLLKGKHRHEVRRKIRRLEESGELEYQVLGDSIQVMEAFNDFLTLFQMSRLDKAEFLTAQMKTFFRFMVRRLSDQNMVRLSFLLIDGVRVAATLCFQYQETAFLYNNGYDPRFGDLSVGNLSKIFSIKESIKRKQLRYDFLKGDELYKKRLGGQPIPLKRIRFDL